LCGRAGCAGPAAAGELADFLAGIGCDRGQGLQFGRPQPAAGFRTLLQLVPEPALLATVDSRLGPVLHPR